MKNKSLKINFIMNSILTMSSFIFPLITFPYISRILLPAGTGKVSFAISFISYFSMFAQLGIPTYGIRACAKVRDDRIKLTRVVHELLIINLLMNVIAYVLLIIALLISDKLYRERTLYIIISFTIFLTTIGMEWLYKALEQYTYIAIRSILFKIIALVAMFLLVQNQSDYIIYAAISIFASSASNILNFINIHKFIDFKNVGNYDFKHHFKPIGIFFAMSCATTIYTHLDVVMLGFMTSNEQVGYYNAAVRIKSILVSIVTSLGVVLLPRASYYVEHNMFSDFKRICYKAFNFVFFLAIPLMVYFIIYAREGICFISGEAYLNSILPLQILMPTLLIIGITNILGIQILVPIGKEKIVLCAEIVGAIIDIIFNMTLIPKMAAIGASIGTLIAEISVLIVMYYYLSHKLDSVFINIRPWKYVVVCLLSALVSSNIKFIDISYFSKLIISSSIYFIIYFLVLLILKDKFMINIYEQIYTNLKKIYKEVR